MNKDSMLLLLRICHCRGSWNRVRSKCKSILQKSPKTKWAHEPRICILKQNIVEPSNFLYALIAKDFSCFTASHPITMTFQGNSQIRRISIGDYPWPWRNMISWHRSFHVPMISKKKIRKIQSYFHYVPPFHKWLNVKVWKLASACRVFWPANKCHNSWSAAWWTAEPREWVSMPCWREHRSKGSPNYTATQSLTHPVKFWRSSIKTARQTKSEISRIVKLVFEKI